MAARMTLHSAATLEITGSEREIEQIAVAIAKRFRDEGGAWVTTSEWTSYIPATTSITVDLGVGHLEDLDSVHAVNFRRV